MDVRRVTQTVPVYCRCRRPGGAERSGGDGAEVGTAVLDGDDILQVARKGY